MKFWIPIRVATTLTYLASLVVVYLDLFFWRVA